MVSTSHAAEGVGSGRGGELWSSGPSTSPIRRHVQSCLMGNPGSSAVSRAEKAKGGHRGKTGQGWREEASSWRSYQVCGPVKYKDVLNHSLGFCREYKTDAK